METNIASRLDLYETTKVFSTSDLINKEDEFECRKLINWSNDLFKYARDGKNAENPLKVKALNTQTHLSLIHI